MAVGISVLLEQLNMLVIIQDGFHPERTLQQTKLAVKMMKARTAVGGQVAATKGR